MQILKDQNLKLDRHSNSAESIEQNELSEIRSDLCENITTKSSSCSDLENPYKSEQGLTDAELKASEESAQEAELQEYLQDPEIKQEIDKLKKEQDQRGQEEFDKLYDRRVVYNIFIVVFICNILINVDHGALPGCYEQIRDKLEINKF